jgi:hypothetical protein
MKVLFALNGLFILGFAASLVWMGFAIGKLSHSHIARQRRNEREGLVLLEVRAQLVRLSGGIYMPALRGVQRNERA